MNKISHSNSLTFGWYITIHSNITQNACKKLNFNQGLLKKLAHYSQKPDMDEILFFRQKHYFFPEKGRSFLDITKTRNARYVYKKHLEKMKQAFSLGQKDKAVNEAGRALHYLQDISQPHHIEEGSIFKKAKEAISPHIDFEIKIQNMQNKLYEKAMPLNIEAKNFDELFENTIKLSQKIEVPQKNNRTNWADIGQKAINITISSTDKFLKLAENYLK